MTRLRGTRLHDAYDAAKLTIGELWLRYFALGGEASAMEIDAYLNGAVTMCAFQHDMLAHPINERLDEISLLERRIATTSRQWRRRRNLPGAAGATIRPTADRGPSRGSRYSSGKWGTPSRAVPASGRGPVHPREEHFVLGLPDDVHACLFDLDGVLTDTASVHRKAWKAMFDDFLEKWSTRNGSAFVPFDAGADYFTYVDGKKREDGVRSFLASRDITLPDGDQDDGEDAETVSGLGNSKNAAFQHT